MLKPGERIQIDLPGGDRYVIEGMIRDTLHLHFNACSICFSNSDIPFSEEVFEAALEMVFSHIRRILGVEKDEGAQEEGTQDGSA